MAACLQLQEVIALLSDVCPVALGVRSDFQPHTEGTEQHGLRVATLTIDMVAWVGLASFLPMPHSSMREI